MSVFSAIGGALGKVGTVFGYVTGAVELVGLGVGAIPRLEPFFLIWIKNGALALRGGGRDERHYGLRMVPPTACPGCPEVRSTPPVVGACSACPV